MAAPVTIQGRWCLTEDRKRLVPEGDPEQRFLWAVDGQQKPYEECVRLGYLVEEKKAQAARNKMSRPARNKGY